MRAIEFLTEARNRMYQYIKSIVPTWPEYIVKDWLYQGFGRYNDENPKRRLLTMLNREGLNRNTQWQFVPNMKFTMDNMWTTHTLRKLQGRAGGLSDMGMDVPRDSERHATQAQLAQKQGGVRSEPVILIKRPDGYELLEGWHRTIQHFHKFPDGYTGPAYVAVAQSKQGVAEGNFDSFKFGKPITFTAYHSSDSKIKRILPTDEFYFSDDRYTWEGNYLYKIKITLKNPYVVLDQKAGYEGHATDSLPKIKAAGYDGVIYTPHSVDYGFRQGVCFYPQKQISNIKLVNSDSGK
jgi:hypothetical protein